MKNAKCFDIIYRNIDCEDTEEHFNGIVVFGSGTQVVTNNVFCFIDLRSCIALFIITFLVFAPLRGFLKRLLARWQLPFLLRTFTYLIQD